MIVAVIVLFSVGLCATLICAPWASEDLNKCDCDACSWYVNEAPWSVCLRRRGSPPPALFAIRSASPISPLQYSPLVFDMVASPSVFGAYPRTSEEPSGSVYRVAGELYVTHNDDTYRYDEQSNTWEIESSSDRFTRRWL